MIKFHNEINKSSTLHYVKIIIAVLILTFHSCDRETQLEPVPTPQGKTVLWLGTSIPEGCTYPEVSCQNLGLKCINNSLGASFLHFNSVFEGKLRENDGLSLTQSEDECRTKFADAISNNLISQSTLSKWLNAGYDKRIIPYLDKVDYVVIDHGYNDCGISENEDLESIVEKGKEGIDWTSADRSNFFGAFNFLYNIIKEHNPKVKVIVGGYFQNSCTIGYSRRGQSVGKANEWIAEHYRLPLLDVWNYTNIQDGFEPESKNYLDSINSIYGTHYQKKWTDQEGNITYFQKFCPDAVHPFTDPTGNSDSALNVIVTRLLQNAIHH